MNVIIKNDDKIIFKLLFDADPQLTAISSSEPKATQEASIDLFGNVMNKDTIKSLINLIHDKKTEINSIFHFYYFDNLFTVKEKIGCLLLLHPAEIFFQNHENNELDFVKSFGHTKHLVIECLDVFLESHFAEVLKNPETFYEKHVKNKWKYFTNYQVFQSYLTYIDIVKFDKIQIINYLNSEFVIKFDITKQITRFTQESLITKKQLKGFSKFIEYIKYFLIEGDYYTKLDDLTKTPKEIFDNPQIINEYINTSRYNYDNAQLIRSKIYGINFLYNGTLPNKAALFDIDGHNKLVTKKSINVIIQENKLIKIHVKWSETEASDIHNNRKKVLDSFIKIFPFIKINKDINPFVISGMYVRIRIFGIDNKQYQQILNEFTNILPDLNIESVLQAATNNIFYILPNISTNYPDIYNIPSLNSFLFSTEYQDKFNKLKPRAMITYDASKMLTINIQNIHSEYELNYFLLVFYSIMINYVDIEQLNPAKINKLTKLIGGNSKILMNNDQTAFSVHQGINYSRYCQLKRQPQLLYFDELEQYKSEMYRIISMRNQTYGRIDYYLLPKQYPFPNLVKNDILNYEGKPVCTLCSSKKQPDKLSTRMYRYKQCIDDMEIKGIPVDNLKKIPKNVELFKSSQKINFGVQLLDFGKTMFLPKKLLTLFNSSYYIRNIDINDETLNGNISDKKIIEILTTEDYIIYNYDQFNNIYILKPDRYPNMKLYYQSLKKSEKIYNFIYFSQLNLIYQIFSSEDLYKLSKEQEKLFQSILPYDTTIKNIHNFLLKTNIKFNNYVVVDGVCIGVSLDNNVFFPINKQNKFLITDIKLSDLTIETKSYYTQLLEYLNYELIEDITLKYLNLGVLKVYDFNHEILFIPYVMTKKQSTKELFELIDFSVLKIDIQYQELLKKIEDSDHFKDLITSEFNNNRYNILQKIVKNEKDAIFLFYEIGRDVKKYYQTYKNLKTFKQLKNEYITILEAETMTKKSVSV